jgi:hypothetical protein
LNCSLVSRPLARSRRRRLAEAGSLVGAAPAQDLAGNPLPDLGDGLAGEAYQVEVAGHDVSATPPTVAPRDWAFVANEWTAT